ncbi:hypothetical protein [Lentibacillus sp. CBA3610]|uniref:hypothetical protein n=1 Tax=Lentibacillus sp. CBA3610 TaxID=2518176 RepID=UPI0020D20BA7|nr:hypothetical protein [Lentibacillus sp. CBA3610]
MAAMTKRVNSLSIPLAITAGKKHYRQNRQSFAVLAAVASGSGRVFKIGTKG